MLHSLVRVNVLRRLLGLAIFSGLAFPVQAQEINARLIDAARGRDSAQVRQLLSEGADPNARDKFGRTALMEAASSGYTDNIRILLEKGADINARDTVGWSALLRATLSRRTDTVRLLLQKGADVSVKDHDGMTALSWASSSGETAIVRLLLAKGANVNTKDAHGWTPLMSAANLGRLDTVSALLEKHPDLHTRDRDGNDALRLAEKYNYRHIIAALKSADQPRSEKSNTAAATPAPADSSNHPAPLPPLQNSAAPRQAQRFQFNLRSRKRRSSIENFSKLLNQATLRKSSGSFAMAQRSTPGILPMAIPLS